MNELIYEGKAKKVFATDKSDEVVIEYKNTATAFNGVKKEELEGKAVLNCAICGIIFDYLQEKGIKTHMIKKLSVDSILVKKVEIIPLEIIVRNVAAGSFSKRFGIPEGLELKCPTLEFCYKNDALGDPMINESQILALGLAKTQELDFIKELSMKVNTYLCEFFAKVNIKLIDFKIEVGRADGEILLADEISPDSCRLWDKTTNNKLDKDRFRRDMGNVMDAYKEVLKRIK